MKPAFPFAASTAALAALAAAAVFAATPALAAQTASGSISSPAKPAAAPGAAGNEAAPATATAPAAPASLPAATPEQQAALAGARPAPAGIDPAQAPTATGSLLTTVFSLILVLALLVGLAWLLKRFGPKTITGGANVKLVGALSVGARERILVVEVGEHWIVVGASPGRMNSLATLPRQENAAAFDNATGAPGALPGANFAEWFKQTIEKRNGK